ncbi:MAG: threonylcarbamoyl-AMP synthase [Lachnospiraceae bacterium]|nr:threonylcarbamoyl-AMP synthase [Lachnospiraceae bacterium]
METIIRKIDFETEYDEILSEAAGIIRKGGLVAFPTETVYGLGADGLNGEACKNIYIAKGRPSDNPLILHISDLKQLEMIVREIPDKARMLMESFWPGPLTIIFKKLPCVPDSVTGGLDTVAVRFPSNILANRLIAAAGTPVAAPSANSSGRPSPTRASHVEADLKGKIDMLIDGGGCDVGVESTIVDITGEVPCLLRPGGITVEMLEEIIGTIDIDSAVIKSLGAEERPKAPGMKYKHYSPNAEVVLVKGEKDAVVEKINSFIDENKLKGMSSGVMAADDTVHLYRADCVLSLGRRDDLRQIASNLFDALRSFDDKNVDIVYSEVFETVGEGLAVMNRLNKAAGFKYIEA